MQDTKDCRLRGKLGVTDWLSGITYGGDTELVQVVFKNTRSGFFRNPDRLALKIDDWVAVEASPGTDIGRVCMTGPLVRLQMRKANVSPAGDFKRIIRKATDSDMERFAQAREREEQTMIRSRQIAAELGLDMKIGDVEYQGDGGKAIFYYIADERVDFRKLIRILADTFKVRIEMKQIGARQEAGRIGGIGPCGRALCCSSWMSRFVSVGTGAARIQDLSMNPQKLAGQCGKLKCCINFETDAYTEASAEMPPKDAVLLTKDSEYHLFKTDILARKVTYSTDKHLAANLVTIDADRALEIIKINRQGDRVESLDNGASQAAEKPVEYVELVGQDSLTRFDKSGKKGKQGQRQKRQGHSQGQNQGQNHGRGEGQKDKAPRRGNDEKPAPKKRRKSNNNRPRRNDQDKE